jgi:hypothetical protein
MDSIAGLSAEQQIETKDSTNKPIMLLDIQPIERLGDYKIHFAVWNGTHQWRRVLHECRS